MLLRHSGFLHARWSHARGNEVGALGCALLGSESRSQNIGVALCRRYNTSSQAAEPQPQSRARMSDLRLCAARRILNDDCGVCRATADANPMQVASAIALDLCNEALTYKR